MENIISIQRVPGYVSQFLESRGLKVQENDPIVARIAKVSAQISINGFVSMRFLKRFLDTIMLTQGFDSSMAVIKLAARIFKNDKDEKSENILLSLAKTVAIVGENYFLTTHMEYVPYWVLGSMVMGSVKSITNAIHPSTSIRKINKLVEQKKEEKKTEKPKTTSEKVEPTPVKRDLKKLTIKKGSSKKQPTRKTPLKKALEADAKTSGNDEKKTILEVIPTTPKVSTQTQLKKPTNKRK